MTTINLNFAGVEPAQAFEALEDGEYVLIVSEAEIKPAKKEGSADNLALVFEVEDSNNKIWHYLNLGPKSLPWILAFLLAVYQVEELSDEISLSTSDEKAEFCSALIGRRVGATVLKTPRNDIPQKNTNVIDSFFITD